MSDSINLGSGSGIEYFAISSKENGRVLWGWGKANGRGCGSADSIISLQIQNPETGLWRIVDRIFPGENWRICMQQPSNGISSDQMRKHHELDQKEYGNFEKRYQNFEMNFKVRSLVIGALMAFAIIAGLACGIMIFVAKVLQ